MPGFILHANAVVGCAHPPGQAKATVVNPNVLVMGQPVATQPSPWVVAGCSQAAASLPFCVTGSWVTGATRVFVNGQPALLFDSQAICTPTATPLIVIGSQTRVFGM